MNNPITDLTPRWRQCLLQLTRTVVFEDRCRLVCIPDRTTAEYEKDKLRRQYGTALIAAKISKNGTGKTGTYTVAYTLRELRMEKMF